MANETKRQYIGLTAAAKLLPCPVSHSTMWKSATSGLEIGGKTIRLRVVRQGRRLFTTREWIDEFIAEQTEAWLEDLIGDGWDSAPSTADIADDPHAGRPVPALKAAGLWSGDADGSDEDDD